jgi:prefoldin subunit 5
MILALAAVQALEGRIESLDAINAALTDDLEKRDEAIKRLRELTLGQQEVGR